MSLVLSSQDVARFTSLQEALLAPLQHETVDAWCATVLRRAETLFHGDRSAMFVPIRDQVHYVSETISPRSLEGFRGGIGEREPGALRFRENALDRAWQARIARGIEVWTISTLERLLGSPVEKLEVYQEAVKPGGLAHSVVASMPVPDGEAFLGVAHSRPADDPFGQWRVELMTILLPALKAGVHAALQLDHRRGSLAKTLDSLGIAVLVCDTTGRTLHQTSRLVELLGADPARAVVLRGMRLLARELLRLRVLRPARPIPVGTREVETACCRYRLRGTYAGPPVALPTEVVLISLEPLAPALPSVARLIESYGLTPREADVVRLLAQGLSNRDIALRLGMSPHTVRHHAEWVFTKLGVHSRKAMGLKLLGGFSTGSDT